MGKTNLRGDREGAGGGHNAGLTAVENIGREEGWVGKTLGYSTVLRKPIGNP